MHLSFPMTLFYLIPKHFPFCFPKQNQDRKHRTYVYVLTVTETLDAWEDSVNIGTVSPPEYLHMLCVFPYCPAGNQLIFHSTQNLVIYVKACSLYGVHTGIRVCALTPRNIGHRYEPSATRMPLSYLPVICHYICYMHWFFFFLQSEIYLNLLSLILLTTHIS